MGSLRPTRPNRSFVGPVCHVMGCAGDGSGCLREAVLAGPVSGVLVEDGLRAGLLTDLVGGNTVGVALAQAGHVDGRRRVLTGMVTVLTVLGLCLFRSEGYDS